MSSGVDDAIAALRRAQEAHLAGDYHELSGIYYSVESKLSAEAASLDSGQLANNLAITMNFLDSWADASNHDWLHYEGISKEDWPALARIILESLEAGQPIVSSTINDYFEPKPLSERKRGTLWLVLTVVLGSIVAYWMFDAVVS